MAAAAEQNLGNLAKVALGLAGAAFIPSQCLFDVDGGSRAVVFNLFSGVEKTVRGEGTHFKIPGVMRPVMYTTRLRPTDIKTTTGTKDLQMVTVHIRMLFKPDIEKLTEIHQKLGEDYDQRVIPSIGNEILKSTIAQYNAEQLLTHREHVSGEIREALILRAATHGILMDDVSITHLTYGKEFANAIEQKQVAEQEAERQKFVVVRAEQERQATVIRSEGEAEAATMISEALKDHGMGLIEVRRIDAAKDIAESLAKSPNVMYLPSGQQMLLNMAGGGRQQ